MLLVLYKGYNVDFGEFENYPDIIFKEYYIPQKNERDIYEGVFILGDDCERMINAWVGTPHLRVCGDIEELKAELEFLLGTEIPLEIERKFLIKYPDINLLKSLPCVASVEITQTYISPESGERYRVRKRGKDGNYIYFHTIKRKISNIKRIEEERIITKEEYEAYLKEENAVKYRLSKERYCLFFGNRYFEIDVFPFWEDKAYIEIELKNESENISLPPYIEIIKEVTEDSSYNNFSLAKAYGKRIL
ncbi:MAG: hypothetical protein J6M16_08110 [Clostridia bacterium]|nr:hypothetical protein [Clostridia bacterium]